MGDTVQILLDAPAAASSRIPIARLGEFKDKRYGDFQITRENVDNWARNLSLLPGGRALIDLDHSADRTPRRTEAAGWITGVSMDGEQPVADVEWTPVGKSAIEDRRYLFFSPTYGAHRDSDGTVTDDVLVGGALTNKPFLNMPMIQLSSDEAQHAAVALMLTGEDVLPEEWKAKGTADSRPAMNEDLLKALDLPTDADDAKVLEAVTALKTKPAPDPEAKTLEQAAADAGKTLLDNDQVTALVADAQSGRAAHNKLLEMEFETAFGDAIRSGRAAPAHRDQYKHFYTLDSDATLKMLTDGPVIVNTKPVGGWDNSRVLHADPEATPVGVHPSSHSLHQQILKTLETEHLPGSDYQKVYDRLTGSNI